MSSTLFNVVFISRCRSTHHKLAMDSLRQLRGLDAEHWRNLFLKYHESYLEGAKAPDDTFKDFKNHVLHVGDGEWGGAIKAVQTWYDRFVFALRQQDWEEAVYSAGVLSHYYMDPIQPFHTGQTEAEGKVHRAAEWSICRAYHELQNILELDLGGYPPVELPSGPDWLAEHVRAGAHLSHADYDLCIDHYDLHRGVKDPPAGLDQLMKDRLAGLIGYATCGFARLLERAFDESLVTCPEVELSLITVLATLKMPINWVARQLVDLNDRMTVLAIYREVQQTGKAVHSLPADERQVRRLHAQEVLQVSVQDLDQQPAESTGTAYGTGAARRLRRNDPITTKVRASRNKYQRAPRTGRPYRTTEPQPLPATSTAGRSGSPVPAPAATKDRSAGEKSTSMATAAAAAADRYSAADLPFLPAGSATSVTSQASVPVSSSSANPPRNPYNATTGTVSNIGRPAVAPGVTSAAPVSPPAPMFADSSTRTGGRSESQSPLPGPAEAAAESSSGFSWRGQEALGWMQNMAKKLMPGATRRTVDEMPRGPRSSRPADSDSEMRIPRDAFPAAESAAESEDRDSEDDIQRFDRMEQRESLPSPRSTPFPRVSSPQPPLPASSESESDDEEAADDLIPAEPLMNRDLPRRPFKLPPVRSVAQSTNDEPLAPPSSEYSRPVRPVVTPTEASGKVEYAPVSQRPIPQEVRRISDTTKLPRDADEPRDVAPRPKRLDAAEQLPPARHDRDHQSAAARAVSGSERQAVSPAAAQSAAVQPPSEPEYRSAERSGFRKRDLPPVKPLIEEPHTVPFQSAPLFSAPEVRSPADRARAAKEEPQSEARYYLQRSSPIEQAPSIGGKTADRFRGIGVKTVSDLLNLDPTRGADLLQQRWINAALIRDWQSQARLVCRIPELRGHDAQILVAVGVQEPEKLARTNPDELFRKVESFCATPAGTRILRSSAGPDLSEVRDWVRLAGQSRELSAA